MGIPFRRAGLPVTERLADQIEAGSIPRCETREGMPQIMESDTVQFGDFTNSIPVLVEPDCRSIATRCGEDIRPSLDPRMISATAAEFSGIIFSPVLERRQGGRIPPRSRSTSPPGQIQYLGLAGAGEQQQPDALDWPAMWLTPAFSAHQATVLLTMARAGRGVA